MSITIDQAAQLWLSAANIKAAIEALEDEQRRLEGLMDALGVDLFSLTELETAAAALSASETSTLKPYRK